MILSTSHHPLHVSQKCLRSRGGCNFEFCLQPKNFSLGLAHRSRWRGDGKERADMPTASDVNGGGKRPSDRTASERERPLAALGSFEQPESSCHLLSIRHYVTALGCLPPFPCSFSAIKTDWPSLQHQSGRCVLDLPFQVPRRLPRRRSYFTRSGQNGILNVLGTPLWLVRGCENVAGMLRQRW